MGKFTPKFLAHKIIKSHPKSYNNAPIEMEQDIRVLVKKFKSSQLNGNWQKTYLSHAKLKLECERCVANLASVYYLHY
jgi:hypothetical protein